MSAEQIHWSQKVDAATVAGQEVQSIEAFCKRLIQSPMNTGDFMNFVKGLIILCPSKEDDLSKRESQEKANRERIASFRTSADMEYTLRVITDERDQPVHFELGAAEHPDEFKKRRNRGVWIDMSADIPYRKRHDSGFTSRFSEDNLTPEQLQSFCAEVFTAYENTFISGGQTVTPKEITSD